MPDRLVIGRLVPGHLVIGRLVPGRLVTGRLIPRKTHFLPVGLNSFYLSSIQFYYF